MGREHHWLDSDTGRRFLNLLTLLIVLGMIAFTIVAAARERGRDPVWVSSVILRTGSSSFLHSARTYVKDVHGHTDSFRGVHGLPGDHLRVRCAYPDKSRSRLRRR